MGDPIRLIYVSQSFYRIIDADPQHFPLPQDLPVSSKETPMSGMPLSMAEMEAPLPKWQVIILPFLPISSAAFCDTYA